MRLFQKSLQKNPSFPLSKCIYSGFFILLSLIVFVLIGYTEEKVIILDDFENGLNPRWKSKEFKGRTIYSVLEIDGNHILKAESNASASGLIYKYKYDPKEYPILTWRWQVDNIIQEGDATKKEKDDYPGRLYVIFPHWFPPMSKTINYIWANKFPKGQHITSAYYLKDIMVAVESGEENIGKWIVVKRNVYEDFKSLFGGEPPEIGGIAIMTDTDNTGESATAYYDDIKIEKP